MSFKDSVAALSKQATKTDDSGTHRPGSAPSAGLAMGVAGSGETSEPASGSPQNKFRAKAESTPK